MMLVWISYEKWRATKEVSHKDIIDEKTSFLRAETESKLPY